MDARITELWRYPVKSMLGERLDATEIGQHGVVGDRSFALIDEQTGKIGSAKRYDLWGSLFTYRAALERPGVARIVFPDGSEHTTADADISDVLSDRLGRRVSLSATAPEGGKYEEVWDSSKGDQMYGPATGEEYAGEPVIDVASSLASPGDFFDAAAIHFLTSNTLTEFSRREPETAFEVRRFRPNIVIEVDGEEGFVENDWKVVRIGEVELRTLMPVPRCVMTTLPQGDLPKDPNVLRSAARHNMVDTKVLGDMPCAGIYAMVASGGTVNVGDQVTIETS
jgi:uncharacterized protein YcbX